MAGGGAIRLIQQYDAATAGKPTWTLFDRAFALAMADTREAVTFQQKLDDAIAFLRSRESR